MSTHELEHPGLPRHKLLEAPILCVSIGMEFTGECMHTLLMVKAYLLNIKRYGIKIFKEVLKRTGIIEWSNKRTSSNSGSRSISRRGRRNIHSNLLVTLIIINNRSMRGLQNPLVIEFLISYVNDGAIINGIRTLTGSHIRLIIQVYPKMLEDSGKKHRIRDNAMSRSITLHVLENKML